MLDNKCQTEYNRDFFGNALMKCAQPLALCAFAAHQSQPKRAGAVGSAGTERGSPAPCSSLLPVQQPGSPLLMLVALPGTSWPVRDCQVSINIGSFLQNSWVFSILN